MDNSATFHGDDTAINCICWEETTKKSMTLKAFVESSWILM